jgi:hypothetical protein
MRTTLDIDDDVLEAAKVLGRRTNKTAGAILSDLARRALTTSPEKTRKGRSRNVGGFAPFDSRGGVVTNELLNKLRESDAY